MCPFVAPRAQCDQVLLRVTPRLASELEVVYLQVLHAATSLASPAVPLQYLSMQFAIALCIESESRGLAESLPHEAFRLSSDKNASCCGMGRNR